MTLPRFFICDQSVEAGRECFLSSSDSHHAGSVLRLKKGDEIEIADGRGSAYRAKIVELDPSATRVYLEEPINEEREPCLNITLVQGLLKGDSMDLVIRQSVELGVNRVIPLVTARSVPRFSDKRAFKKQQRWEKIARSAASQSGRTVLPEVDPLCGWEELNKLAQEIPEMEEAVKLFFWEGAKNREIPRPPRKAKRVLVLVGPEGGFNQAEARELESMGFQASGMGPRILRAETAAVAALTAVQLMLGDLGGFSVWKQ